MNYLCQPRVKIELTMTKPITSSEADLLRLIVAGDDQAFTTVYRRHQPQIYRFALLMSGSVAIAEDVTQEVFLVLIREAHHYDPSRGPLSAYLYGIARNYVLRSLERDRSYVPLVEEAEDGEEMPLTSLIAQDDPLSDCARGEVIKLVRQAVLALPARYREVVVLCDFQELSYAEAATVLGCAIGTINSRLHRGHALLLKKLRAAGKLDATSPDANGMRCFA
jgi:RNA polymerase sigma-70 factor (ECF subfamily)